MQEGGCSESLGLQGIQGGLRTLFSPQTLSGGPPAVPVPLGDGDLVAELPCLGQMLVHKVCLTMGIHRGGRDPGIPDLPGGQLQGIYLPPLLLHPMDAPWQVVVGCIALDRRPEPGMDLGGDRFGKGIDDDLHGGIDGENGLDVGLQAPKPMSLGILGIFPADFRVEDPGFVADLDVFHPIGFGMSVCCPESRPSRKRRGEVSVNRSIAIGHQRGGPGGSLFQGSDTEESVPEIDRNIGFGAVVFTHPQELVVTEAVGDRRAEFPVWPADRTTRGCPSGEVVDHVGPVEKIDIRSTRKTDHRNLHAPDESGDPGLEFVGSGNDGGLDPGLSAEGGPLHELPEQARIDRMTNPVIYPDGEGGGRGGCLRQSWQGAPRTRTVV